MNTARTVRRGITVIAMVALCVVISVPAYAAYEDSLKGYWKMDDLSADDDFSSLNSTRWSTVGTVPYVDSGTLRCISATSPQWATSGVTSLSKFYVYDDFDVIVQFNDTNMPAPTASNHLTDLKLIGTTYYYLVENQKKSSGDFVWNSWTNQTNGSFGSDLTSNSAGWLRLTRTGSTINGYRSTDGTNWGTAYATITGTDTSAMYVQLYSQDGESSGGGSQPNAAFDNFKVVNGERAASSTIVANTGTIYGATQTTGKTGYNTALYFDGTDDYVKVSSPSGLPIGNTARTIEGWIYKTGTASEMGIIQYGTSAAGEMCGLITSANAPGKLYFYGHAQDLSTNADIPLNEWIHVAMTYDGSLVSLYMNGELDISAPLTLNTVMNSDYLTIGLRPGIGYFQGGMDDFAIFNRALDANEIGMLYDLGTEKFEWLTLGVNDTDNLNLGYTTSELRLLADLYAEGDTGTSETIDGLAWHYLSGDLPGDIGGITYDYGDTWTYDGKYYLKLGSGLEGTPIPEPGCALGLLVGFFVPGFRRLLKRWKRGMELSGIKIHSSAIFTVILMVALMATAFSAFAASYEEATGYWKLDSTQEADFGNYFGTGADGNAVISSNTNFTVAQDGDMVVKNYHNLTINSGVTLSTSNRCKGMLLYVDGDLTVNGTISMSMKGAYVNPVTAGVSASGLQFARVVTGGTGAGGSNLSGAGAGAINAESGQDAVSDSGKVFTISRLGGTGGAAPPNYDQDGLSGNASTTSSGGGGSGGNKTAGAGAQGTCFSGGSGGGAGDWEYPTAGAGTAYGGPGGNAGPMRADGGVWDNRALGGGAGHNPGTSLKSGDGQYSAAPGGGGGLITLVVKGNINIGSTGKILSQGSRGTNVTANAVAYGGGGAGGGNILILHGGELTNQGTISAAGGAGGTALVQFDWRDATGGAGGNGAVQVSAINDNTYIPAEKGYMYVMTDTADIGAGKFSNALVFDGIDDFAQIDKDPELVGPNLYDYGANEDFTVNFWMKRGALLADGKYEVIMSKSEVTAQNPFQGYILYMDSGEHLVFYGGDSNGGQKWLQSQTLLTDFEWHNISAMRKGNEGLLFIDGVLDAETAEFPAGSLINGGELLLGKYQWSNWSNREYFDGALDEVGIWDRALDEYELEALYEIGMQKFEAISKSVNGEWGFDLTTEEIGRLARLYVDGKDGLAPDNLTLEGSSWSYLSGLLPGDDGSRAIGEYWEYGGKYYIKLGSGLEGTPGSAVPEPGCALGLILGFFVPGFRRLLKRKV